MHLTVFATALCLAAAAPLAAQDRGAEAPRRITVTGVAEAEAVPDLATVTAGVETRADTAVAALAANSEAMTTVFAALEAAGIERREIQTSQLSIGPVYGPFNDGSPEQQKVIGYEATNTVTVRVRKIDELGSVIDALADAGSNRLFGIGFEIAEPKPHLDAARERAVADARGKAELFARAAGVTLGPVLSISEAMQGPGPIMMRAEAMADAAPPIAEGTVTLQAQVEIVYGIE
jgi:uncharacterized protein